jgi:hypothetical protein
MFYVVLSSPQPNPGLNPQPNPALVSKNYEPDLIFRTKTGTKKLYILKQLDPRTSFVGLAYYQGP